MTPSSVSFSRVSTHFAFAAALSAAASCAHSQPPPKPLQNAAQVKYGASASVQTRDKNGRDNQTPPEAVLDNNVHTHCVLRGAALLPYTWTIRLSFPVPIDRLAFADSDYKTEQAPKYLEIVLDDKTTLHHTLAFTPSAKRSVAWQEVPVGKTAQVIKITVLTNHVPDAKINWGGIAEIAVLTPEDMAARFALPGAAAQDDAAVFVHVPQENAPASVATVAPVRLPVPVPSGEHPRLLLSKAEIGPMKADIQSSPKGQAAYAALLRVADAAASAEPVFPDPKGQPAQLTDRGDAPARAHSALSEKAGTLGMAYALTGDEKYARRAADIVRGYAARYAQYTEHKGVNKNDTGKVMGQRLSEAMWLISLIEAYDYIYQSPALTPADHAAIENDLIRPAVAFIRSKDPGQEVRERDQKSPNWRTDAPPKGGAANWLLFYNAATIMAGAVLNDANLKDLAFADFKRLLQNGIGPDGMWEEGAIGYQFFALSALTAGAETAARQNMDLWGWNNRRLKMLFDSPLRYAYPDGTAPGINDSSRTRFGDWSTMCYDYAFLRYNDPAYGFLVNASPRQLHQSEGVYFPTRVYQSLPEPTASAFGSTVFDGLGYGVLRNNAVYALMDYGPHGGTHGHFDKLNLILFASGKTGVKGDEMGGEPRFHRYEDTLHDEWTKVSIAHNTVSVDGASQVASEGKLLLFEDAPSVKVMRAQSTTSLPGALLDRTVLVLPGAVLDIFTGRSASPRTWDKTLRFNGTLAGLPPASAAAPLGDANGYQHLSVAARVPAAQAAWTGTWQTTQGAWSVLAAGAPAQEVVLAHGPDDDNVALVRQANTTNAAFATAYQLQAWENPITALQQLPTGDPDLAALQMTQKNGEMTTVFVASGTGGRMWQANGWTSDARVVCVQKQGGKTSLLLAGGTFAKNANGEVRLSRPGNAHAEQTSGGSGGWNITREWEPVQR